MKILTVDIGTGTQDIFLYDSRLDIENGYKLILPSPTMMVRRKVQECTRRGEAIALHGLMMGGGPSHWAVEEHLRAGYPVYATPAAARSFNDDLEMVRQIGIQLLSDDEIQALPATVRRIEMKDFDFPAIEAAFRLFGVELTDLCAVAVAVFDHGDAPPSVSDRQFRFEYLDQRLRAENRLSAFAYLSDRIPPILTRLRAVAASAQGLDVPLVVMDTAPAAVLGALFDPMVARRRPLLIANVGNFHTLAFRIGEKGIEGLFEHHTGFLDLQKLENLLIRLAEGSLRHAEVFEDMGHGALVYEGHPIDLSTGDFGVAVTGPRRKMMKRSKLRPYFAAPFGDMMITGCFGLLAAVADRLPELAGPIYESLSGASEREVAPWDVE
ncbi:MAG: DUF1786 domain-containing protein [Anaerolineales bacterium]|nr:DUF1786 domain-containing protein [Anaerolineales bacterium]MDW8162070.1 DUF1786 domain-containing protein [Anaerolineales bacterium]